MVKPIQNSALILLILKGLTPEGLPGPAEVPNNGSEG